MYALFRELHERVQKEGTPAKGAGAGPVASPRADATKGASLATP